MLRFPKFSPIADYKHLSPNIIEWRRGWNAVGGAIEKMKKILEGRSDPFTSDDFVIIYNTVYTMCIQKPPFDYSQKLYDKYKEAFEEYIRSMVLPSLRRKHDEPLLRELVKRWTNNNTMVRWLSAFFLYLDGYFIPSRSLPSLKEVGLTCFRELVYEETKGKAREAVIALIDREREGEQIDRALLKSVIGIYVEIGMGKMDYYVQDFETYMLSDTAAYYSRKASSWIVEYSLPDYILKAGDCLRKEKERVLNYLHASSEPKLLENVQNELLVVYSSRFVEKEAEEHSGFLTLLRDDKVEDITRMFRPFYQCTKGPDPVANTFKQELTQRKASMVYCSCGLEAVVRTSWTLKNPGRRFYGCPNEGWRCRFVGWIDPEVSERESHIIKELLRSGNMVEEEVEASRKEIREETARWKKYLLLSWIGFVGILAASK